MVWRSIGQLEHVDYFFVSDKGRIRCTGPLITRYSSVVMLISYDKLQHYQLSLSSRILGNSEDEESALVIL